MTSGNIGGLFGFTQPLRAVEGLLPNGGPDGQSGGCKAGTINIGSEKAIVPREVTFTFGVGDLTYD